MRRAYHPTYHQKYVGRFGKDINGIVEGSRVTLEYIDFNVGELPSSREEIVFDIVSKSIDGLSEATTHSTAIQGSLNNGVSYGLMQTHTTGTLSLSVPIERQIITIPWTPRFRIQMNNYASEQALFYVTVLV
jgi:hypothetical protein